MSYEQVLGLLERFGFPAAVAAFVLIRLDRQLQAMTRAVDRLTVAIHGERQGLYGPPSPPDTS